MSEARSNVRPQPAEEAELAIALFHGNWFARDAAKLDLTDAERRFIAAALGAQPKRWQADPDVAAMARKLAEHPRALDRIGGRLLVVAIGMRGAGPAVALLLQRGVALTIDNTAYNVLHEAAWAGAEDTLRAVFESGAADATCVSVRKPHVGWPDNLSLMYWAACRGRPGIARLLIAHGVGMHHERKIKGNGERGTTSLHEALAPSPGDRDPALAEAKRAVARLLIEDGAVCDIYATCALDDAARLRTLLDADAALVNAAEDYGMTPLLGRPCRCLGVPGRAANPRRGPEPAQQGRPRAAPLGGGAGRGRAGRGGGPLGRARRRSQRPGQERAHAPAPCHLRGTARSRASAAGPGADPTVRNKADKTAFAIARKGAKPLKQRA